MTEDQGFLRHAVEWASALVGVLVGVVYKKHESDIGEIREALKCKLTVKESDSYQTRAEVQRQEMREGIEKVFDRLDQQGRETQNKFDSLITMSTQQHLSLLAELNKKVDR